MVLPLSRSQLDKLGKRLAAGVGPPSGEDRALLQSVLAACAVVLDEVVGELRALGFQPTSRVKTEDVLIEKLRRHAQRGSSMGLKGMQDIAGARIIVHGDRRVQDAAVNTIVAHFDSRSSPSKSIDRRVTPSAGYRAVHAIVHVDALPVEVQVRTANQDAWAQLAEAMGDVWGRGLRYGEGPDDPTRMWGDGGMTRAEAWGTVLKLADALSRLEEGAAAVAAVADDYPGVDESLVGLTEVQARLRHSLDVWKRVVERERR